MTKNEAIEIIKYASAFNKDNSPLTMALEKAIQALEENQQYHAIGTVEGIEQKLAELKRWHTNEVNPKIKNEFANTSTQICHNCDHKDEYIVELEAEIEERQEAIEQQTIKNNSLENLKDAIIEMVGIAEDTVCEADFERLDIAGAELIGFLDELERYRAIGNMEEVKDLKEKLDNAKEDIRKLLCSEYGSSCQFCIHDENDDAMCCNIGGSGSWCCENARWQEH